MNDKSIPPTENLICAVCRASILTRKRSLKKHSKKNSERSACPAWSFCSQHQRLFSEGFIALIEFDPGRSKLPGGDVRWDSELTYGTGRFAHIERQVFNEIFSATIGDDQACVFAEMGMIDRLKAEVPDAFF